MKPVRIFGEAEVDINEAAVFYEAQRQGLGVEFFEDYQATLAKLVDGPLPGTVIAHPRSRHRLCHVFFRVFPYKLVVAEFPTEYGILAVARQGRHPDYWRPRLAKVKR